LLLSSAAQAQFSGRRVSEVLDELRAQGYTFIYNTQIVPADLRVTSEPHNTRGVELAEEILAAHGLSLAQAAPRVYAVVARPAPGREQRAPDTRPAQPPSPLEEVVVQTSRYSLALENVATQTFLTQEQVKDMPRLADETLRAIQRLPGTAINGFSSIGPVRGGAPNETAILLDGLRLYEPFHLKNFLSPVSLLDSRLIDGMDFYSGGFPAVYGDRMSAIIDTTSVHPAQPRYYELGLNLFHASALAASEFDGGRGHALVSGRRSNIGDLAGLSESDFGEPHYWDAFGRVDYRPGDTTLAAFNMLVSSDEIDARKESGEQSTRATYRNIYAWATLDHDWSQHASSRLIASYTDLTNNRHGVVDEPAARTGSVSDEREFHVVGLRLENALAASGIHHRFGAEVRRLWGTYEYSSTLHVEPGFPFPDSPGSDRSYSAAPQPEGFETSAYWDALAHLGSRWTIQGGMRVDTQTYDHSDDAEQWSPRLSLLYELDPQTHLRASWGRFFQSQGINELQVEDGIAEFWPAQHADHAILSFDHAFDAGIDLRIEAYRKYYRELYPRFENMFDPLVLLPEAEFDRVRIDAQRARASGIEMLLRLRPHGSWSGWLSYALSRADDRVHEQDVPRSWDQRHAVSLGIVWTKGPWNATLTDSFHTGWPTTELQITDPSGNDPQIDVGQRNRSRLAYYNTLDFRVTRTFVLGRGALDVFVEVNNALSRENPCCVSYQVTRNPDGSLNYVRDVDSWLPLVPSMGVLWRY
jgi:TonB dependent receptor-like, beta-barrel/TonB-dependent Receptor Plug Domain